MEIFTFLQQPIKIMPLAFNLWSLDLVKNAIALEANVSQYEIDCLKESYPVELGTAPL